MIRVTVRSSKLAWHTLIALVAMMVLQVVGAALMAARPHSVVSVGGFMLGWVIILGWIGLNVSMMDIENRSLRTRLYMATGQRT